VRAIVSRYGLHLKTPTPGARENHGKNEGHNVPSWLIQLSSGPVQCRLHIGRTQDLMAALTLGQSSMPHCRQLSRFHHAKIWRNEESRGPMKNLNLAQENARRRRCAVLKKVRGYTFFCLVYRRSEISYDRSEVVRFQIAAGLWGFGNRIRSNLVLSPR
jgi:hypothetical protein